MTRESLADFGTFFFLSLALMTEWVCYLQVIKEVSLTPTWMSNLHGIVGIFFRKQALLCCRSRIFYKAFIRNIV